jgi:hypothetical protein
MKCCTKGGRNIPVNYVRNIVSKATITTVHNFRLYTTNLIWTESVLNFSAKNNCSYQQSATYLHLQITKKSNSSRFRSSEAPHHEHQKSSLFFHTTVSDRLTLAVVPSSHHSPKHGSRLTVEQQLN